MCEKEQPNGFGSLLEPHDWGLFSGAQFSWPNSKRGCILRHANCRGNLCPQVESALVRSIKVHSGCNFRFNDKRKSAVWRKSKKLYDDMEVRKRKEARKI